MQEKQILKSPRTGGASILVIYTGGTFGMEKKGSVLAPVQFDKFLDLVPEIERFEFGLDLISSSEIIDSSEMQPSNWVEIATCISDHYEDYTGFVILHGTDTLAFSSSALSFMLTGLSKAVVFTGAILPIGDVRNDARENFITACQVAAATNANGSSLLPEVSVCFHDRVLRGNRVTKTSTHKFSAIESPNFPPLAKVGADIDYDSSGVLPAKDVLVFKSKLATDISTIKLFPGLAEHQFKEVLMGGARAIVLETFGSGNAPASGWMRNCIKEAIAHGKFILNITQCLNGGVEQLTYESGSWLEELGVVGGADLTFEVAITKLMHVMANYPGEEWEHQMSRNIVGELSS